MCGIGGIINLTKNAKKLNIKDISTIKNHLKREVQTLMDCGYQKIKMPC